MDGHLRCLGNGSLVIERLSKQQSKQGVKFVNLLRSSAIPVRHCKNVTCEFTGPSVVWNAYLSMCYALCGECAKRDSLLAISSCVDGDKCTSLHHAVLYHTVSIVLARGLFV